MPWPFLLPLSSLALSALSVATAQDIESLSTLDSTCNGQNVQSYLTNSLDMLSSSVSALDSLLGSSTFVKTSTRNYMKNAANAFGTQYYSAVTISGLSSGDKTTLTTVQDNFKKVQSLLGVPVTLSNGQPLPLNAPFRSANSYLSCDDSSYHSTTIAQDIDPSQPDGTSTKAAYGKEVLWYIPGHKDPETGVEQMVYSLTGGWTGEICAQSDLVGTVQTQAIFAANPKQPFNQIILCPICFDPTMRLQSLASIQSSSQPVGFGNRPFSNYIGYYRSAPGAFIHELFHGLSNAFYDTPYKSIRTGEMIQPYGPEAINVLARDPDQFVVFPAMTTLPDAYRIFAEATYLSNVKWSSSQSAARS